MKLLRKIGFPFSLVYGLVVSIRNMMFDKGIFKSLSFDTPTICVGNLSVGGTGKTPMIEYLIALLKKNKKLAVLSRGYGRKSKGYIKAEIGTTVEQIGDEPFQIHKKFPEVTMVVDADRRHGISLLETQEKPDLILLDDAFQHRKVQPAFSILLTAYDQLYIDDWYVPTGNLRDSKREARRADLIVVTKCPSNLKDAEQEKIIKKLHPLKHQQVLFSSLVYDTVLQGERKTLALGALHDIKISLVTGIANPGPLVTYLKEASIVFEHLEFGDHHFFTEKEINTFNSKEMILTTEKDFVRLKGKVANLFYIRIEHSFIGKGRQQLLDALASL
ncbi:tetraacyldisaccharide 4'-kinase [Flavobacteriaceae bacterium KMM 6897]|nr:tetraacyldisaccharide 4'-kinase [Flavobacteriaceae bacterium KMM 6897]MEB8347333.1 tetraacyldisaccharide 4'-kinase [Flavobacteriaceae bacterium KMM 6898]